MPVSNELLELLVCPKCKSDLSYQSENDSLLCKGCSLLYPIRENIPVLLEEEAFEIGKEGKVMTKNSSGSVALFKITEGPNKGNSIKLPIGSCKAIGRSIDDINKTQLVSLDPTVPLDDFTKKLVMNYLSKKLGKTFQGEAKIDKNGFGEFKRLSDLVLDDPAISRLHAMIFYDQTGVGILDLVSRNGTYVNGQEIESRTLQNGDLIEIGATKIVFGLGNS